jgi:peroxiredoxin
MKKYLLLLTVAVAALSTCTDKNAFVLKGTIENATDLHVTTVLLQDRINREYIIIDSAEIKDGKFSFSTICDSSRIAYLTILDAENPIILPLVFESGKVTVNIDFANHIYKLGGTAQNAVLQSYTDESSAILQQYDDLDAKLQNDTATSEKDKRRQLATMDKKTMEEYAALSLKLAKENINTPVGTYIFLNAFSNYLSPAENDAVYALMNETTKANPSVIKSVEINDVKKSVEVGQQFLDIKGINPAGDSISLSQFVGKTDYVLLDFWASWCIWCVRAFPDLKEIYSQYGGKQFEVVGFSLDGTVNEWNSGITKNQLAWKQISDLQTWETAKKYGVYGIPATFLIDKNGEIVAHNPDIAEIESVILEKK